MAKKCVITALVCAVLMVSLLIGCSKTPPPLEELVDFVVEAEEGREFRILQITDVQLGDDSKYRLSDGTDTTPVTYEELYANSFYYIEETVKRTQPDLIIMTGDNVQGELDDDGLCLQQLVAFMESLEIPWAPIFGNHDNESAMGVSWQCRQFEEAEYCLFKRGNVTGNSNYTIGIEQSGKLIKVLYMMDSNGCAFGYTYSPLHTFPPINEGEKIKTSDGFAKDQVEWITSHSERITNELGYTPSKFLALHINIQEYADALIAKGYMKVDRMQKFTINDPTGEDFGGKYDLASGTIVDGLWEVLKAQKFDGVFAGHQHQNYFSVVYEGIRLTHGLKTGHMAYHSDEMLGATFITVAQGGERFSVENIFITEHIN